LSTISLTQRLVKLLLRYAPLRKVLSGPTNPRRYHSQQKGVASLQPLAVL
jgi:hypothetical protein